MILPQSILGLLMTLHFANTTENPFPQDYFRSPVDFPISLSGSFSELRPNHFHSGIDIKTLGQEGVPMIAVADGYVSRVKILPNGLGKALYIDHPNGYTSVYGHLSGFEENLEKYIRNKQYELESFEVDFMVEEGLILFEKGDTVAFSGNSGSSHGPHLHFEIRHTATEWPINPLLFGIDVEDNIAPKIKKLRAYPVGERSVIDVEYYGRRGTYTKRYQSPFNLRLKYSQGKYTLSGVKSVKVRGKVAFGIELFDYMNGSHNTLDLYQGILKVNDSIYFSQQRNTFGFEQTRYINAHVDFEYMQKHRIRFQRFYKLPGNNLPFYNHLKNNGVVEIEKNDTFSFQFEISDYFENKSLLEFEVYYLDVDLMNIPIDNEEPNYTAYFSYDNINQFKDDGIEVFFPAGSFYEDFYFNYEKAPTNRYIHSPLYKLHDDKVPVHSNYTIKIKADQLEERHREKAVVVGYASSKVYWSNGGHYEDGWMVAYPRGFGNFAIMIDSTAPVIKQVNIWNNSNMTYKKYIQLKIYDNLSGIDSYYPTIDGRWVLMEYDGKSNTITYVFDDSIESGEHIFRIIVIDRRNNTKELELKFKK
jgi:hypothetical protein